MNNKITFFQTIYGNSKAANTNVPDVDPKNFELPLSSHRPDSILRSPTERRFRDSLLNRHAPPRESLTNTEAARVNRAAEEAAGFVKDLADDRDPKWSRLANPDFQGFIQNTLDKNNNSRHDQALNSFRTLQRTTDGKKTLSDLGGGPTTVEEELQQYKPNIDQYDRLRKYLKPQDALDMIPARAREVIESLIGAGYITAQNQTPNVRMPYRKAASFHPLLPLVKVANTSLSDFWGGLDTDQQNALRAGGLALGGGVLGSVLGGRGRRGRGALIGGAAGLLGGLGWNAHLQNGRNQLLRAQEQNDNWAAGAAAEEIRRNPAGGITLTKYTPEGAAAEEIRRNPAGGITLTKYTPEGADNSYTAVPTWANLDSRDKDFMTEGRIQGLRDSSQAFFNEARNRANTRRIHQTGQLREAVQNMYADPISDR